MLFPSRVYLDSLTIGFHLRKGGKIIIVFCQIRIENCAVMFCHSKRRMPQKLLQSECIAAAVNEILSRERVSEEMYTCLLDTAPRIVACNGLP